MSAFGTAAARPLDRIVLQGEPDARALVLRDRTLTYAQLDEAVGRLAAYLRRTLDPGDRVASWAAKGWLTCVLPLAAARAGMVHVPVNPLLKRAQTAHILEDSEARMLLATQSRLETFLEGDVPPDLVIHSEPEAEDLTRTLDPLGPSKHDPADLVALLYTSGSTGKPKGVMLSHANLWLGAESVATYLKLATDDVTLAVLPLSFDYGQNQLLSTWYAGGTVVPLDYLFARDVAKACAKHSVTTLAAVPPLWRQLNQLCWKMEQSLPLRRLTNSGGALTRELVSGLRATFPQADLYPMYGLTEAFRSTYLDPALVADHPTSIGTAVPHAEILVMRNGQELSDDGEEGELVHCGPLVAQGYWRDVARTEERFRPAPPHSRYGGTAVWSGDRVVREPTGLLYFVGRNDGMMKVSGNRISPQEIEDAARRLAGVDDAIALGIPDEELGHAIWLYLTGEVQEEDKLLKDLASELPNFMMPKRTIWKDAFPLNANGKIDRALLSREAGS